MARRHKTAKRLKPKTVLRSPDLEQSKNAVLNSLAAALLHQWTSTQCLSCTRWSPHSDWYAK